MFLNSGPTHASPPNEIPESPRQQEIWPERKLSDDLDISSPPRATEAPPAADAYYYSYPQALTFRVGVASDLSPINFKDNVIGFQYLFPKFLSPRLEAGADLHNEGNGHVHAGARWYWHERSYFRPSYKFGGDIFAQSSQGMATILHWDNYFFRMSATLEYVVWNPWSLRLEHELLINHKSRSTDITLGVTRGW